MSSVNRSARWVARSTISFWLSSVDTFRDTNSANTLTVDSSRLTSGTSLSSCWSCSTACRLDHGGGLDQACLGGLLALLQRRRATLQFGELRGELVDPLQPLLQLRHGRDQRLRPFEQGFVRRPLLAHLLHERPQLRGQLLQVQVFAEQILERHWRPRPALRNGSIGRPNGWG